MSIENFVIFGGGGGCNDGQGEGCVTIFLFLQRARDSSDASILRKSG